MKNQFFLYLLTCLLFTILPIHPSYTQQEPDSLKALFKTLKTDESKINILNELGNYFSDQDLDSSLYYFDDALKYSKSIKNDSLTATSYANVGTIYLMKGKLDTAMEYQLKALSLYGTDKNDAILYKSLNSIGLIYLYQSKFDEALLNFNKVFNVLEANTSIPPRKKDEFLGILLNNIGIIYDIKTNYNKALEYYSQGITHSKNGKDEKNLASLYSNMGLAYLKLDKLDLAESYFNEALDIRIEINDAFGQCKSYQHLGNLYKQKGEYQRAETLLQIGLEKCKVANASKARAQILEKLSLTYALSDDFKNAYEYQLAFTALNDSLSNSETQRKITEAEMQYKFDKETQRKEALQQKKQYIYIIIGIVLFLGMGIAFTLYRLVKIKAKNQLLAKEKVELENKELSLRKQTLENELESRSKDLTTNVMYLIKKNELISEVSQRLMTLKKDMKKDNQKDVQRIIMDLQTAKDDAIWDEFEVRFNQVYNDFYERLNEKFPDLTNNEKKICAFLKLNMTTKEICTLTRQSTNSLNVARTRLRKKLGLSNTDTNLTSFLENI